MYKFATFASQFYIMISKKIITALILLFAIVYSGFAQEKVTISGVISASNSNETIIGVTIAIPAIPAYTTSNEYGFYSITIPKGNYTIAISSIGFQTKEVTLDLTKNTNYNIKLTLFF